MKKMLLDGRPVAVFTLEEAEELVRQRDQAVSMLEKAIEEFIKSQKQSSDLLTRLHVSIKQTEQALELCEELKEEIALRDGRSKGIVRVVN